MLYIFKNNAKSRLPMNAVALSLAFAVVTLVASSSTAQVSISVDTAEELSGSFTLSGNSTAFVLPTVFDNLPKDSGLPTASFLELERNTADEDVSIFASDFIVFDSGEAPEFAESFANGPTFADMTGSYVAATGGPTVFFSYTNLADTGGANGTFSGDFSFVIPEPASALLVAAGGLILGVSRKRRLG